MSVTLPAGTYYVGDPCYCFDHESWRALGAQTNWFADRADGEIAGRRMAAFGTKHGNGTYADGCGNFYPVDSGLIGAVPVKMIDSESSYGRYRSCGHEVTFEEPVECREANGVIYVGDVAIDTDPPDDD